MTGTLQATIELARRVDGAEIDFCAVAGGSGRPGGIASVRAGGGLGLYGSPGSPFNKVLGLGLHGHVLEEDLDRIQAFYASHESAIQIELCPLAEPDLPMRLCARGYVVQGFENELARPRPGAHDCREPGAVRVTTASTDEEDEQWIRITAEGFAAAETMSAPPPIDAEAVEAISRMMRQFRHPSITRYLAWIDGDVAGGGATYLHDGVLGIVGTATHPRFRRRGVQRALVAASMAAAPEAELAMATTAPGSVSQRTFERLGFQVIYTRVVFVRPFHQT